MDYVIERWDGFEVTKNPLLDEETCEYFSNIKKMEKPHSSYCKYCYGRGVEKYDNYKIACRCVIKNMRKYGFKPNV